MNYQPVKTVKNLLGQTKINSCLFLIIIITFSIPVNSQNKYPANYESRIDAIFKDYLQSDFFGAAVIIAQDGKLEYQKCFGLANIQHHVPVTIKTKFRIGSITKQFTASAIFKLQEQGLLNVNDCLSKYIPDYPSGDQITIYKLLTQTSGIPDYTQKDGFWLRSKIPISPDSLIKQFKYDNLEFTPGTNWQYSNANYFLLGYIIEKASGKKYEEYLKENFFIPLKMQNTGVHDFYEIHYNEASGYEYGQGKIFNAEIRHGSHYGGAGSLYSTAEDLFIWNEAVFNGKVLSKSNFDIAMIPVKWGDGQEITDDGFKYGCGWGMMQQNGHELVAHGGGFNGFDCWVSRYPQYNLTIIVLTNCSPFPKGLGSRSAAFKIAEICLEGNK
jgi:CubicO group peptidase (beta-lactamase class C family)